MTNAIVLGVGYGDCGKGRTVSYLCSQFDHPLVVRFNGGHQCGHTVVYNGIKHVSSTYGSGVLQEVPTLYSKYCTMYPTSLITEFIEVSRKVKTSKIYFNELTAVTTPLDIIANRLNENTIKHGTCGFGIGATFKRMEKGYNLYFQDLLFPNVLHTKLKLLIEYYSDLYKIDFNKDSSYQDRYTRFMNAVNTINDNMGIHFFLESEIESYITQYNLIFEGAQGIMLDQNIGFFPHVTPSNTTSKNAIALIKEWVVDSPGMFYVTRSYQTRHGNGPTGLDTPDISNVDETNKQNRYQGEFKCRQLDPELIKYAILTDKLNHDIIINSYNLVITCIDQLKNNRVQIPGGSIHISKLPTIVGLKFDNLYWSYGPETNQIMRDNQMGTIEENVTSEETTEDTPEKTVEETIETPVEDLKIDTGDSISSGDKM